VTRIYLPTTLTLLKAAAEGDGRLVGGAQERESLPAHAVTSAVREWYTEGDSEELEYAAMLEAAEACLGLLAVDPDAPRRRVVLAADVPDGLVLAQPGARWRSAVLIAGGVDLQAVVSMHLDEDEARSTIAAAADAVRAAADGDEDAEFAVAEAEGFDLLWYDITELPLVLAFG
jgi:hypothetical protein